ncbi:MAG TPA: nicotinamide riboside transporter PnuC [Streptosporangiaceae bacterium]|nr:nicotinamide riboside transporter PnuC [Streptosporangiaceae bacterium]
MAGLAHLLAPLNVALFTLGNDHVSVAELLGFVTGAASVWLTVLARISNFPVGIANSAFFLVLFASARLFADSGLQVVYIVLGFAGWWQWLHGGPDRTRLVVARSGWPLLAGCALFVVSATWGLTVLLRAIHDIAPFWDALTTAVSLAAQFLLNCKKIENWAFWIMADLVYIPLYVVKRLDLTAVVYVLFLAMCLVGVSTWRRALRSARTVQASPEPAAVAGGGAA